MREGRQRSGVFINYMNVAVYIFKFVGRTEPEFI